MIEIAIKKIDSLLSLLIRKYDEFTGHFNDKQKVGILIFILLVCIYLLNHWTLLNGDDFIYAFHWGSKEARTVGEFVCDEGLKERISSLQDIIESQYSHYFTWGGRFFSHAFIQLFVWLGKPWFNIANTLFFVAFTFLIYFHVNGFKKLNAQLYLLLVAMVWFLLPSFSYTTIWLTGSCVYLWGLVFILAFLLPYRLYAEKQFQNKTSLFLYIIPIGLIAGWSNENTSAAMLVATVLFLLFFKQQKWPIPAWSWAGLASAFIGFVFLAIAPGNYIRSALTQSGKNPLAEVIYRLQIIFSNLLFSKVLFIILITTLLYLFYKNEGVNKNGVKNLCFIYLSAAFTATFILVSSSVLPLRTLFGFSAFLFIVAGIFWMNTTKYSSTKYVALLLPVLLVSMTITLNQKYTIYKRFENRISIIEDQKSKGINDVRVPVITADAPELFNDYVMCGYDITGDSTFWANRACARYYGIHSIIATP